MQPDDHKNETFEMISQNIISLPLSYLCQAFSKEIMINGNNTRNESLINTPGQEER